MDLPIYQLDSFASGLFKGNPAAVVPLDAWLPDATMQSIAAENNLSETAFYVPSDGQYAIRWFTPSVEADLCGHATLATAALILDIRKEVSVNSLQFNCRSGVIAVSRDGERYSLDFPSLPGFNANPPNGLYKALGATPSSLLRASYYLAVFDNDDQVHALDPNMYDLASVDSNGVIVTAPGKDCDFVSRMFAPAKGIPEDPVTGSAHCTLTPYWSQRLNKKQLFARQISSRGGELWCQDRGDRVSISGHVVKYLEGTISIFETP